MENLLIDVNNRFQLTEEPVNLRICKQKQYNSSNNVKDIEKRWQEYTEELYKKDLHDPDNHDGVITPRARHPGM